jgi:hypothetical protein
MQKIFTTAFLISLIFSCANDSTKNNTSVRKVRWGDLSLQLPKIESMTECYAEPKIASFANQFEVNGNQILALYLNDITYGQKEQLGHLVFDDYFKIYATEDLKLRTFTSEDMDEVMNLIKSGFISNHWDEVNENLKKDKIEIGKPYMLDNYKLNDKVQTIISISKFSVEGKTKTICTAMNALLLKNKLIWLAYYKEYVGKQSLAFVKEKNDSIVLSLLAIN